MLKTLNGRPTDEMFVERTAGVRFVSVLYPLRVRYISVGGLADEFTKASVTPYRIARTDG